MAGIITFTLRHSGFGIAMLASATFSTSANTAHLPQQDLQRALTELSGPSQAFGRGLKKYICLMRGISFLLFAILMIGPFLLIAATDIPMWVFIVSSIPSILGMFMLNWCTAQKAYSLMATRDIEIQTIVARLNAQAPWLGAYTWRLGPATTLRIGRNVRAITLPVVQLMGANNQRAAAAAAAAAVPSAYPAASALNPPPHGGAPPHGAVGAVYPGASPAYPGATPAYPGASPAYPGATPAYPGASPAYPGATPAYPGAAPGYQGMAHAQSGVPPVASAGAFHGNLPAAYPAASATPPAGSPAPSAPPSAIAYNPQPAHSNGKLTL